MNANSLPQTPAIKDWLKSVSHQLSAVDIPNSHLDAEIILAYALGKNRTYLHTHDDDVIDVKTATIANKHLSQRLRRVPIAYIVGHKEFYGRQFSVTKDTLIPRPESEAIIDLLKKLPISHFPTPNPRLIDIGTGSGCLGITAKLEFPALDVTLTDVSTEALKVAISNAKELSADVATLQSDLLQDYTTAKPDIIIANLPYVDQTWKRSPETDHEPALALFADNHGRSIIEKLIVQASSSLTPGGYMIIEADPTQHSSLIDHAKKQSFVLVHQLDYAIAFTREISNKTK